MFIWPCVKDGRRVSTPEQILFNSPKIKIHQVACGFNFAVLVTTQGLVYTFGKSNNEGQLGLGDTQPRGIPELVLSLKEAGEKVDLVECGFKHCIAKTSLGKVYTWGWGTRGQLGHNSFDCELSPRRLEFKKQKSKAL